MVLPCGTGEAGRAKRAWIFDSSLNLMNSPESCKRHYYYHQRHHSSICFHKILHTTTSNASSNEKGNRIKMDGLLVHYKYNDVGDDLC